MADKEKATDALTTKPSKGPERGSRGTHSAPKGMTLHSITTKRLKDGSFHHEHRFTDKDGNPHHITHEYASANNQDAGDHVAQQFLQGPPPDAQASAPETVPTGEEPGAPQEPEMAGV